MVGGSFLAVAVPLALLHGTSRHPSLWTVLLLLVVYAVASQVEFEVGAGSGVPTELVLVPMLFVLPAPGCRSPSRRASLSASSPRAAGRRITSGGSPSCRRTRGTRSGPRSCSWPRASPIRTWHDWPVFVAALGAQFVFDYASSAAREWIAFRLRPRMHLRFMVWVWALDAALAPIGFAVALAAVDAPASVLLVLPLIGLLGVFARQRQVGIDRALELGHAYRGTAFLLGDVVEADDSLYGHPLPRRRRARARRGRQARRRRRAAAATRSSSRCSTTSARSASPRS